MTMSFESHEQDRMEGWMTLALEQADQAASEGEVPIGSVAVLNDVLVSADHNRSIQRNDPSAHAEIEVLRSAGQKLGNYRLNGLEIYVTVEPCPMCAGALIWSRSSLLVFGARDDKAGGIVSKTQILNPGIFNHTVRFREGILAVECRQILTTFFARKRGRRLS